MHAEALLPLPGVTNNARLGHVEHLFNHVQFAETVELENLLHSSQLIPMFGTDVLDVSQPLIGESELSILQRGFDAAAAIVTTDNHMTNLEHIHRVLEYGQAVGVADCNHVGNIAMNEELSGQQSHDFIGRYTAVCASNPQVLRLLQVGKPLEEPGVPRSQLGNPPSVVIEELFQLFHWDDKLNMRFGSPVPGSQGKNP